MHVTAVFQGIGNHDPMKDRIYTDAEMGNVVLRKNIRSRRVSIRVHPVRGVTVTLPYFVPYAEAIRFLRSKKEWVMEVMERQKSASGGAVILSPEEVEYLCDIASYGDYGHANALDLQGTWKLSEPGVPKGEMVKDVRLGKKGSDTRIVIDLHAKAKTRYILTKGKKRLDIRLDKTK